jgi:hypothetical protein
MSSVAMDAHPRLTSIGTVFASVFSRPRWILGLALVASAIGAVVALVASAYTLRFAWLLKFVAAVNIGCLIRAMTLAAQEQRPHE